MRLTFSVDQGCWVRIIRMTQDSLLFKREWEVPCSGTLRPSFSGSHHGVEQCLAELFEAAERLFLICADRFHQSGDLGWDRWDHACIFE